MSSPTYDYYGADRIGMNLFSDCLLALDARTGKRLWHFQMVHHDLWDYDPTAAPQLITVRKGGKTIDAVAQATKQGFVFVFDRVTGEPVWPIEERPVPKSDVPGEQAWPTQPFSTLPPTRAAGREARRPHAVSSSAMPNAPPGASASQRRAPACSIRRRWSRAPSCPAPSAAPTGATPRRTRAPACSIC